MLGVETDLDTRAADLAHDATEVGEGGTDSAAGAGGVLEDELDIFRGGLDHVAAGDANLLEDRVEPGAFVATEVKDDALDAQLGASVHGRLQRAGGALEHRAVRGG